MLGYVYLIFSYLVQLAGKIVEYQAEMTSVLAFLPWELQGGAGGLSGSSPLPQPESPLLLLLLLFPFLPVASEVLLLLPYLLLLVLLLGEP